MFKKTTGYQNRTQQRITRIYFVIIFRWHPLSNHPLNRLSWPYASRRTHVARQQIFTRLSQSYHAEFSSNPSEIFSVHTTRTQSWLFLWGKSSPHSIYSTWRRSRYPWSPFTKYLALRDHRFPFRAELWLKEDGSIPTRASFLRFLRRHFSGDVGGHSLRAGGATALAEAGIPPHIIQAIGRWSSDAFQIYIRRHPVFLAALLYSSSRWFLALTIISSLIHLFSLIFSSLTHPPSLSLAF